MFIKDLAFSAQQRLEVRTGGVFRRAHIYELLAASFGFGSYAALRSEAVFAEWRSDREPNWPYNAVIGTRCVALGYPPEIAEVAALALQALLAESRIDLLRLTDLVLRLRDQVGGGDVFPDRDEYDPIWDEPDPDWDDGPEEAAPGAWFLPDGDELPAIPLDDLEAVASKGNALAHYALALIHASNAHRFDWETGSGYWYSRVQRGHVLTGVPKALADGYARQEAERLAAGKRQRFHLREAAQLGNEYALLYMAERFGDPSFFEKSCDPVDEDPVRIAEIAARLGRNADEHRWLTIAAESGDTDAMRALIEGFDHGDLPRCWAWLYLARLLGTDLTESDLYAINEDGSRYDDDVGGPAFLGGREGIALRSLDAERDRVAWEIAAELFGRMPQAD